MIFRGIAQPSGAHLPAAERPIWAGTIGPVAGSPVRRPRSVRRTSSVDILWPDGISGGLALRARARDLVTGTTPADATIVATGGLSVDLAMPALTVVAATLEGQGRSSVAVGAVGDWLSEHPGHFRMRGLIERDHPEFVASGSPVALLVDEIPAAALISGASLMRSGLVEREGRERGVATGVCAGWIENGSMHVGISSPHPFLGEGPPAPSVLRDDDPLAWHDEPDLPVTAIRRRRRIDVVPPSSAGGPIMVDVHFRDSFLEPIGDVAGRPAGLETVIHEYGIELTVDPATRRVLTISATPHVLPSPECPSAAASAQRLVGMSFDEIRAHVRDQFRGTSTCTHLNDALRSVGDLGALMPFVAAMPVS